MITGDVPSWLFVFQSRFTAMLRTPLDPSSGTYRTSPDRYDAELRRGALPSRELPAAERLATYNRQYWLRLFGVVQSAFPLTARLLGYFAFNGYASRFLTETPPRTWNIDRVPDGFEAFLARTLSEEHCTADERTAIVEAAELDAAWRRVFLAPAQAPFRPTASDAQRLLTGRLRPSEAVAVLRESFPLLSLRARVLDDTSEAKVAVPERNAEARHFALVRRPGGIGQLTLAAREARLFELLVANPVSEALALLEAECPEDERASLPAMAQRWLAHSVELDFWSGIE
jgi:hypothetical protein